MKTKFIRKHSKGGKQMKKTRLLSLLALSAVLAGCAEKLVEPDVKPEEKPGEEQVVEQQTITVSLPDDSEVESKVSIEAGEGKLVLNWEKDDQVTIIGAKPETFKLSEGEGTKVAKFTGNKVEPAKDGTYTLIYPAVSSDVSSDDYDNTSYESQTQTGNNSISHIRFNAKAVSTTTFFVIDDVETNGAIKFYMKLPPEIGKPTEIIVNSPTPIFYATNAASAEGMVDQMSLKLKDVLLGEDRILTAYMMTAPQTVNIDANAFLKITVLGDSDPEMKYVKNIKPGAVSLPSGKVNVFQLNDQNWASYKLDGEGTEASPYLINSWEELQMMRASLVHGKTLYYKLMDNIDMESVDWEPLNWEDPYDCGIVFDGNGKTLSNLKSSNRSYAGFAGVLYGELHHVTFDNAQISNDHNCGVIGGFIGTGGRKAYVHDVNVTGASTVKVTGTWEGIACGGLASNAREATVENCKVNCTVLNESDSSTSDAMKNRNATGGIIGKTIGSGCSLKDLHFTGSVTSYTEKYTGGILGWQVNSGVNIENCTVDATITSEAERVGGIVGHFEGGTISGCRVKGTVEQKSAVWNTGGIAGIVGQKSEITNCTVEASVSSSGDAVGGILGQSENDVTITNCSVSGNVDGHSQSGGVVGQCSNEGKNIQIERCHFSGTLSAADNIGGIVGYLPKGTKDIQPCVKNCAFTGTISSTGQRVGGIVGELAKWGQIYNCISTGNITGWQVVGGICGRAAGEGWNNDTDVSNIVEKCLVWGASITATRENTDGGSSAVVVGYTSRKNQLTDCFRSNDVDFNVSWPGVTPYDQNNSKNQENYYLNCNEIPGKTFNFPYHGKVSAGKASDKARDLKWEETVWDLSKDVPALILK